MFEHGNDLYDFVRGPLHVVKTRPIYFVNGHKFHTQSWSEGKKTIIYGVYVKDIGNVNSNENDFYGIVKEIIQLEYLRQNSKKLVLFSYGWFNPIINHGIQVHPQYGIVKIKHFKRHGKYDHFIFT